MPNLVTWKGWQAIDEHESARGEPAGRPRIKLVELERRHEIGCHAVPRSGSA